jgi:ankyrin repeat protein
MSDASVDILDTIAAIQEGDYETVKTVLENRLVSPNSKDDCGCTLLHWAAINNRAEITRLLIEHGANSCGGGVLNESPLQWALRKRYYCVAEILVKKLHVDLRHKSSRGIDALHLCCRLS